MSFRNWFSDTSIERIGALALAAAFGFALGASYFTTYEHERQRQYEERLSGQTYPSWYNQICGSDKSEGKADLCQQIRQAKAAEDAVFWSRIGVAVAAIGTTFLVWNLYYARGATKASVVASMAAKKSADAAMGVELPRFVLTNVGRSPSFADPNLALRSMKVRVDVTNLGNTDAVILADYLWVDIATNPNKNAVRISALRRAGLRTIIAKGKSHSFERSFQIGDAEIRAFLKDGKPVWVSGFVTYIDFLDRRMKFGFAAALECPDGRDDWQLGQFVQFDTENFPYHEQIGGD